MKKKKVANEFLYQILNPFLVVMEFSMRPRALKYNACGASHLMISS